MERFVIPDTPTFCVHELKVGFYMKAHKRLQSSEGKLIVNIFFFFFGKTLVPIDSPLKIDGNFKLTAST